MFRFLPGYHEWVYDEGKEPLFLLVLAFLVAFSLARGYTRLARTRGWGSGAVHGVHLHHVVPGIVLVLGAGLLAFSRGGTDPVLRGVGGILFGVGAALVLDEFALMFYLRDVCSSGSSR